MVYNNVKDKVMRKWRIHTYIYTDQEGSIMAETQYDIDCGTRALGILRGNAELAVMQDGIIDDSCIKIARRMMLQAIDYADPATCIRAQALDDIVDKIDDIKAGYQRVPAVVADIYSAVLQQLDDTIRPDALATYYATAGYQTIDWAEVADNVQQ